MNYSWDECVIALYKSKVFKDTYRKLLGDYTVGGARRVGSEFNLKEDKSGVFTLGRTGKGLPVNAKRMRIFCPWHEDHDKYLQAIDSKTLVCTECDPRLKKLL